MKRLVCGLVCLVTLFLTNCEKEKMIPGEVGIPVYLVPDVDTSSDTLGCNFEWNFVERPLNSNLSILSFQPSNNGYNIYFIPDVSGDFRVKCKVLSASNKLKKESIFLCKIKPGESKLTKSPLSGTVADDQKDIAPVYLEDQEEQETMEDYQPEKVEEKPAITPKPPVKTKSVPTGQKGLYTIQISSFKTYANAEKELNELKNMGMTDIFIKKTFIKSMNETWYRIRTNSYPSKSSADAALMEVRTKFKRKTAWIDKIN